MIARTTSHRLVTGIGVSATWSIVALAYFTTRWSAGLAESESATALRLARSAQQATAALDDSVVVLCVRAKETARRATTPLPSGATEELRQVGCGVVIDSTGAILTTRSIVVQHPDLFAKLFDGRVVSVVAPQCDEQVDIALVRPKEPVVLPTARVGDGDSLRAGEWVVAVERRLNNELSVYTGAIGMPAEHDDVLRARGVFYVDGQCRPRTDGTPLVDLAGNLVGISTNARRSPDAVGAAIAVSRRAPWVRRQLPTNPLPTHSLGFHVEPVTPDTEVRNSLSPGTGALVTTIFPDTPGTRSGLQVGDVILVIGDRRVASPEDAQQAAALLPTGVRRPLEIVRDGWRMTLHLEASPPP